MPSQSLLEIVAIIAIAWCLSERRTAVRWQSVAAGIGLQLALAILLLKIPLIRHALGTLNGGVIVLSDATRAGTSFVFGYLGGAETPFPDGGIGTSFILAFQALPLILVISALSALLFHWNIIQPVVRAFATVLSRTIGVDGPAGVATTMNIFVGMTEAPLVIRPYLERESRSGLFVIMTAGMATVAGTVMVLYATMLQGLLENPIGHLLTASIMAAPAAIAIAFVMVPEDRSGPEQGSPATDIHVVREPGENTMSVITRGAIDGAQLIINIIAMLIVLVALVSLANAIIGLLPDVLGAPLTLQRLFGWIMAALAWLIGIPWQEAPVAAALLGTKTVLNELIAYSDLAGLAPGALSPRGQLIMTYTLCGFANFGSLGIMIGGMSAMAPARRAEIVALAPKALILGTFSTCLSGAMVGFLTWT